MEFGDISRAVYPGWRYIDADGMSWLEVYGGWRYIEVVSEVKIKTARISGQAKSWRYIERRYSEV